MSLTVDKYNKLLEEHKSIAGIARATGRNERSLRRWIKKNIKEIDKLQNTAGSEQESLSALDLLRELSGDVQEEQRQKEEEKINDALLKALNKNSKSMDELAQQFNTMPDIIQRAINDIKQQGYVVEVFNGIPRLSKTIAPQENIFHEEWKGEKVFRFGVCSDKHLCSKYQQLTLLNKLYDIFEAEGINTVFDPGDICDGFKMRPGHEHELFVIGADDQADYIIKNHPYRKGITTKFILGNHDTSHIKNGGHDIGVPISREREDMQYLGTYNAKVNITPNCVVELNHPLDGSQYALSYSSQKMIDSMSGGEKPNILLNGHHHKLFYMIYRNIHAFECGTMQEQSPWMRGKRLAAHVGGIIIEVHVDKEGTITRCKSEFIPFYKMIRDDYLNWK